MTITRLHKLLSLFVAQGHGRKPVYAFKDSFKHPLEADGAVILDVASGHLEFVSFCDDDGDIKLNKDGTESGRVGLVLCGSSDDRLKER